MQRVASDVETEMGPSGAMPECRGQAAEWQVMRPRKPRRPRGPGQRFKPSSSQRPKPKNTASERHLRRK